MKLQLQCDDCGVVGDADSITTSQIYERDLCDKCYRQAKLEDLRQQYAAKKQWLEDTHLKILRQLEAQIQELESKGV